MNKEQEEWSEKVFQSMKGSKRAIPRPDLFKDIEAKISASNPKVIPISLMRKYAAAVILLLLVNISALVVLSQNNGQTSSNIAAVDSSYETLGNSFQIYN